MSLQDPLKPGEVRISVTPSNRVSFSRLLVGVAEALWKTFPLMAGILIACVVCGSVAHVLFLFVPQFFPHRRHATQVPQILSGKYAAVVRYENNKPVEAI